MMGFQFALIAIWALVMVRSGEVLGPFLGRHVGLSLLMVVRVLSVKASMMSLPRSSAALQEVLENQDEL